jgi:AbrB family looped-hinge helix DNA binding protein
MQTTIDKAGRIVIPKAMRDALGVSPGGRVDIVFFDGRIEIEPACADVEVDLSGDFPAIRATGPMPPLTEDVVREAIEATRR